MERGRRPVKIMDFQKIDYFARIWADKIFERAERKII